MYCSNCGMPLIPGAAFCTECGTQAVGFPQRESKLVVYGITQKYLIGGTLKIYADGMYLGEVRKNESAEFPILRDCVITAQCGINPLKAKTHVRYGVVTVIRYEYDRMTSAFNAFASELA